MVSRSIADVKSGISVGQKVCLVSGKFNVLHPGHLRLFRHAKEICDYLVVALYPDGWSSEVLLPAPDRLEGVRANIWVDEAFILSGGIETAITELRPDVVLKGKEHDGLSNIESDVLRSYGGALRFAGGHLAFSSNELLSAEERPIPTWHAEDYLRRHDISYADLIAQIGAMDSVRTLVIGDLIVDRYIDCEPVGMSAEDPTVVVTPISEKQFLGGASIVAAHADQLGGGAHLISIRGDDVPGNFALKELDKVGVTTHIFCDVERPTTFKTRYRARNQTLLRVNDFRDHHIDAGLETILLSKIYDILPSVNLVIFSDFNYGLLTNSLVSDVIEACRERQIVVACDSQSSSQVGDVTKFQNASLITPTEREARLAVRDANAGLVGVAEKLRNLTNSNYAPITLGSEGVFLHYKERNNQLPKDDQIPALNRNPIDVAGAGDAFLVATGLALASGSDIWSSMYIGSMASATQVGRVGNLPLKRTELLQQINE